MSATNTNYLEYALIITAIVLVGVIWMLAQVLITLSKSILKKRRSSPDTKMLSLTLITMLISSVTQAQDNYLVTGMEQGAQYGGMSALKFYSLAAVVFLEIVVIAFLSIMIRRSFRELSGETDAALAKVHKASSFLKWWNNLDKNWMTRAVPLEKEADVLLDHDYDGIKELDNALPPWWKYGFYITIFIGFIYLYHFHVSGNGKNPEQEYAVEMLEGAKQEEEYKAKTKDLVDENNITLSDAAGIAAGKELFTQSCIACHAADGGGGIGPNLTDNYWIHGGNMNDIYKTIKIGYPEKGMQSWQSLFSPVQMKNIASFVHSLKGTKAANPKDPQGELMQENATATANDTTSKAGRP
jgi:cytochrome c oxidase cbb3-type subunit 3